MAHLTPSHRRCKRSVALTLIGVILSAAGARGSVISFSRADLGGEGLTLQPSFDSYSSDRAGPATAEPAARDSTKVGAASLDLLLDSTDTASTPLGVANDRFSDAPQSTTLTSTDNFSLSAALASDTAPALGPVGGQIPFDASSAPVIDFSWVEGNPSVQSQRSAGVTPTIWLGMICLVSLGVVMATV